MSRRGSEISTARTVLRAFADCEKDELLRLFRNPSIRKYLLDDELVSADWMTAEITSSRARFANSGAGLWSVRAKGDARIIGFVGFREFFDPPQLQLLYGLLPAYWGRGLATESATSICDYAFRDLGFDRVSAAIDVPNTDSKRVLERLGMTLERITMEEGSETAFYGLQRGAWEAQQAARSLASRPIPGL